MAQLRQDHGLAMPRYDVLTHLDMADGGLSTPFDRMEDSGLIRPERDPLLQRAWATPRTSPTSPGSRDEPTPDPGVRLVLV